MDIQVDKIQLAKMLLETENPKIIQPLKKIFDKAKSADFWNDLSDNQKDDINKATIEIENGEFVDFDTFIQKHK